MKFFDGEHVSPVKMNCVGNTRPLEVRYIAYIIPILGYFLTTSMYVSNVRIYADNVIAINAHVDPHMS